MNFISTFRIFKLGLINFFRNGLLSVASTMVIAITVFIVGVFAVQSIVILNAAQGIQEKLNLAVYFNDDVKEEEIDGIRLAIANRPDVKSVEYTSKEDAYQVWLNRRTSEKVRGLVTRDNNPLPRSLEIKTYSSDKLATIAKIFESDKYEGAVRRVSYKDNQDVIETLVSGANSVSKNGLILSLVFTALSFILIYNTTRIVILSRKNEIEIMRLVGSTEVFVRIPFLIEAALFGMIGVLISLPALYLFLKYDLASATPILSITKFLAPDMLEFFVTNLIWIAPTLLVIGIGLSVSMSSFAVRKYVKV